MTIHSTHTFINRQPVTAEMEVRRKIQRILTEAKDDLCSLLPTDRYFLQDLLDGDIFNRYDKETLEKMTNKKERRQEMVHILQEKPSSAYFEFMSVLRRHHGDLYQRVKELETKHGLSMDKLVSNSDMRDLIDVLGPDGLHHLFSQLGLKSQEIAKAECSASTNDFTLIALAVLRYWRRINGQKATHHAILEALERCHERNMIAKDQLERIWTIKDSAAHQPMSATSSHSASATPSDMATTVSENDLIDVVELLSSSELRLFYYSIGLYPHEIEKAEMHAGTRDVDLQAKSVLLRWSQQQGQAATRKTILDALEENKFMRAKEKLVEKWLI